MAAFIRRQADNCEWSRFMRIDFWDSHGKGMDETGNGRDLFYKRPG